MLLNSKRDLMHFDFTTYMKSSAPFRYPDYRGARHLDHHTPKQPVLLIVSKLHNGTAREKPSCDDRAFAGDHVRGISRDAAPRAYIRPCSCLLTARNMLCPNSKVPEQSEMKPKVFMCVTAFRQMPTHLVNTVTSSRSPVLAMHAVEALNALFSCPMYKGLYLSSLIARYQMQAS